ncbi:18389_t:CDS:2, partial [Racocetra persica]
EVYTVTTVISTIMKLKLDLFQNEPEDEPVNLWVSSLESIYASLIINLVDSSLKILQRNLKQLPHSERNSEAITTSPRPYIPIPCQRSP